MLRCFAFLLALGAFAPAGAFDLQGHRGARGLLPENSLPAFERALEIGVTTLELDIAVTKGRKVRTGLKVGICGEHGGDPASIQFCHKAGLDYVSCSPFRVPIARLAAAQAALRNAK